MLSEEEGKFLVKFTRKTIENFVKGKETSIPEEYPEVFEEKRGVFVTLEKKGDLRGCIGLPYPEKTLIEAVKEAACSASQDPRFDDLREEELDKITIEVSVLTEPEKIEGDILKNIEKGKDGLILKRGIHSGLFLPQVWDKLPEKKQFLEQLCHKAGLMDKNAWKDSEIFKFKVQAFKEKEPGKI